ncbi:OmpH family outer membrane protein [uncultured Polaribacter sp.]|uniref:OmpH family outer membrane protein n=1 Tax=uncultured Polaribacter sp. TaxID=174711 RepID=UPI00260666C2|nr:OmpH family outer membrane protein [uncultured Polaribacter sp.]
MKSKITILFITFISTISIAQTKVGTINNDYIINLMPEAKTVIERTQKYGAKLDSSFSIKMSEFQAKVDDFKKKEKEMGPLLKKTTIQELTAMEKDIQQYQENGNKLMQLKQNELMRPLYKMLNDAISSVVKENGYTQILTTTGNDFAYIDEKYDITKLVMTKLNIKEPAVKN